MNFQTPPWVCDIMASLVPLNAKTVLEPTPGDGNLVAAIERTRFKAYEEWLSESHMAKLREDCQVLTPERLGQDDFWKLPERLRVDCVVMNPPFSPMAVGYKMLYRCMEMSSVVIALMPWLALINSEKRTQDIIDFGLKSVRHLPRKAFPGSRVQCCILEMDRRNQAEYSSMFIAENLKGS